MSGGDILEGRFALLEGNSTADDELVKLKMDMMNKGSYKPFALPENSSAPSKKYAVDIFWPWRTRCLLFEDGPFWREPAASSSGYNSGISARLAATDCSDYQWAVSNYFAKTCQQCFCSNRRGSAFYCVKVGIEQFCINLGDICVNLHSCRFCGSFPHLRWSGAKNEWMCGSARYEILSGLIKSLGNVAILFPHSCFVSSKGVI